MERHLTSTSSMGSASPLYPPPHPRLSGRRSFMSKPVYPLLFLNPVSTPTHPSQLPHSETPYSEIPYSETPYSEIQDLGSRDLGSRHGFRWSNASSSFDFDGAESVDIQMELGLNQVRNGKEKCGICERMLWQKSPWSSNRIIRNGDMPTCGVLSCCHVYHADCLEESVVKGEESNKHEPVCPVCDHHQRGNSGSRRSSNGLGENLEVEEKRYKGFRKRVLKNLGIGLVKGRIGKVFRRVGSSSKNPRDDRGDSLGGRKK